MIGRYSPLLDNTFNTQVGIFMRVITNITARPLKNVYLRLGMIIINSLIRADRACASDTNLSGIFPATRRKKRLRHAQLSAFTPALRDARVCGL